MIPADAREINVSDTVEFLHKFITYPTITPEDCILHGLNTLSGAIKDAPTATQDAQIKAITALGDICSGWAGNDTLANPAPPVQPPRKSLVPEPIVQPHRSPRVKEVQHPQKAQQPTRAPEEKNRPGKAPKVHFQDQVPEPDTRVPPKKEAIQEPVGHRTHSQSHTSEQPIARRTRSQLKQALSVTLSQASQIKFPRELLAIWCMPVTSLEHIAMPVLDPETGETLEYRQLHRHPKYRYIWETSYCNELRRLY